MHYITYILLFVFFFGVAFSKEYNPFDAVWKTELPLMETPSNMGYIGLLELPSARILQDGHLRMGYSQTRPYSIYYATIGLLPRLEAGLRVTDIYKLDIRVVEPGFSKKFGSYKDQSPHLKFLLKKEGRFLPAVAVGAIDFVGTGLFKGEYIVASKYNPYIIPMDVTVGYGHNRFDGFFAGGEIFIHPRLSFLWEYSPIDFNYEKLVLIQHYKVKDKKRLKKIRKAFPKKKSKYNFGLKINFNKIFQTILSYQYGDAFGFNIAFNMKLGEPWLPHIERRFVLKGSAEDFIKKHNLSYEDFISYGLYRIGFRNISVYTKGNCLCMDLENKGYLSNAKALLKIFELIRDYPPKNKNIKYVEVVLKSAGFPVVSYREQLKRIYREPLDFNFLDMRNFSLGGIKYPRERVYPIYTKRYSFGYRLKLDTKFADRSGYVAYKLKLLFPFSFYINKNFQVVGAGEIPFYKNITLKSRPYEKVPIRSDFVYYFNNMDPYLTTLKVVYFDSYLKNQFINIQAGYLEPMYAGIGGDIFYVLKDGIFAVGIGGDIVKKRDYKNSFKLIYKDYTFKDFYFDFYTYIPGLNVRTVITLARFLGGDRGVRFTFSRSWKGFDVGAWYTYSNSKGFKNYWNRSKKEYGFFIAIPFRMFQMTDTPRRGVISMSIFNRDIGQLVGRGTVIDRIYKYTPAYIMDPSNWY
jgi:hypothetical protein